MDAEHIKIWLKLQAKSIEDLKSICKSFKLPEVEDKDELIRIIVSGTIKKDTFKPQVIPLRTRDNNSQPIKEAMQSLLYWRKLIFQYGKDKEFSILNNKGQSYYIKMKSIKCLPKVASEIVKRKWYLPYQSQSYLIKAIEKNPEAFCYHIVQKQGKNNNNWVMLHVIQKETGEINDSMDS